MFILQFPGSNGGWGKSGGGGYRGWKRSIVLRGGIECLNRSWVDACIIQSCKGPRTVKWVEFRPYGLHGRTELCDRGMSNVCAALFPTSSRGITSRRRNILRVPGIVIALSVRSHRGNHVPRLKLAIVG